MSFELPQLDRKTWQQLQDEMIRRIPQYTKNWTDYNASDPGITLIQLLAWLDESLLYQANQIPLQSWQNVLRWVLGLAFSSNQTAYSAAAETDHDVDFLALRGVLARMEAGVPLDQLQLQTAVLGYVQRPYMALTLCNVETLVLQTNLVILQQAASTDAATTESAPPLLIRRAYAIREDHASTVFILSSNITRYQYPPWPNTEEFANANDIARKVLLVQVPALEVAAANAASEATLLTQIRTYLQPRVLAGNRVLVRTAQHTDINLTLSLQCAANTRLSLTLNLVFAALFRYFLPCEGGNDGLGWGYDQAPLADDIRHLVLAVPGVAAITAFEYNFIPTVVLNRMATLDVNALLASLPPGTPALDYHGLPRLRVLDVTAVSSQA